MVDHEILSLIKNESLLNCEIIDLSNYVQPASIDLPITSPCYLVKDRILPYGKNLRELIENLKIMKIDLDDKEGGILLKGQTYLAYCGRVKMPKNCRGSLSPKSSIGRIDVMVRGVFDGSGLYDTINENEEGELWFEITPRSFHVKLKKFLALSQMMVFKKNCPSFQQKQEEEHNFVYSSQGIPLQVAKHHNGSVILHLGLETNKIDKIKEEEEEAKREEENDISEISKKMRKQEQILGWEAIPTGGVIDLSKSKGHIGSKYFRPIFVSDCANDEKNGNKITLEKDKFYILATKERICIPPSFSAEMVPFSHHIGELRAHYAGFFDPGFGFSSDGSILGTVGVLEVRPHETITIFDGQPICLLEYFQNTSNPTKLYGHAGNNYQQQKGAKLAKYFIDE